MYSRPSSIFSDEPSSELTRATRATVGDVVDRQFVDLDGRPPSAELLGDLLPHALERGFGQADRLFALEERDAEDPAGVAIDQGQHPLGTRHVPSRASALPHGRHELVDPADVRILERSHSCVHTHLLTRPVEDTPVRARRPPELVTHR
jgi:hypothetical protein